MTLTVNHSKSVFETQPSHKKICQTLAVITERKIDAGHCIKFKNRYYIPVNENGIKDCFYKGTKATVIETFDKRLICCINDRMYDLDVIDTHERFSRNFDFQDKKVTPVKRNIPDAGHPWRNSNYLKYRDHKLTDAMLVV